MRKKRQIINNSYYHVTARANRREYIFENSETKDIFISVLKRARMKYKFEIRNFCIMGNHIHLFIKPLENESLSIIMQWILSVFAIIYNKKNNLQGHVWYDRFKSKCIESYQQYLNVYRYIINNPVKAGIVEKAADYIYSGIFFIKLKMFDIVDPPNNFEFREFYRFIN